MVKSTSYFEPDSPRSNPILTTGWICFIVILSLFQALRWLGRSERVGKMRKWQGKKAEKGEKEGPASPQFPPMFFFCFVFFVFFFHVRTLSIQRTQISPGTWNRLSHPQFQILGHACKETNGQLATFYLLGYWYLLQISVVGCRACKLAIEAECTSTINKIFTIFIIYSIHTQVSTKTRVFACFSVGRVSVARYLSKKPPQ